MVIINSGRDTEYGSPGISNFVLSCIETFTFAKISYNCTKPLGKQKAISPVLMIVTLSDSTSARRVVPSISSSIDGPSKILHPNILATKESTVT